MPSLNEGPFETTLTVPLSDTEGKDQPSSHVRSL